MPFVAPSAPSRGGQQVNTVLGQRYSLERRIAVGGMGEVWAATDTLLGRKVAVKILRDDLVDSPGFLERFRAEARHTASLAHPGIAAVFDYGEELRSEQVVAYLVMELVPGQPLSNVLADRGTLPVGTVLSVLAQTAEALQAAHAMGVIHRDIKPGNLILLEDGTIKVTDFGIARAVNSASITAVGQVIGTARYLSPEQASGVSATPASDIYSLGVVGYEMLTGQPPFIADNPAALAMAHLHQAHRPLPSTVPPALRAAIDGALSKDPTLRPVDARTFAAELRRLQSTTSDSATTSSIEGTDAHAATRLMSTDADQFKTEIMPPGRIVGRAVHLGLAREAYASRRHRRWIAAATVAVVVVGIVLLQLGAVARSRLLDGQKSTVTTASVTVDPKALIGLPVAAASDLLSKAGLLVTINYTEAAGTPQGVVTSVEPVGEIRSGSTVMLDVSNGNVPSTTAAVTTTGPGNGKGKKDHGKPKG